MSPWSARSRCSSKTCETSPWSRMAMMWPFCAVAMPADSCPRCCSAKSPKYVRRATSRPGALMPNTPHSSRGPSRRSRNAVTGSRASVATAPERSAAAKPHAPDAPARNPGEDYPQGTMAVNVPTKIDEQRVRELIEREEKALNERTGRSSEMYRRAHAVLSGGVASSYQLRDPWPIYLERGSGFFFKQKTAYEMYDFHNGFG